MSVQTESPAIKIAFPYEPGMPYDYEERFTFWDSPDTIKWFKDRGYTLYQRVREDPEQIYMSVPTYPSDVDFAKAEYPYAAYDTTDSSVVPLHTSETAGKVVFAQDSLKRHVAIKLVRGDTDEYRILKYLSKQSAEVMKDSCIIPVLDLLPIEGFWFVVMPRWGTCVYYPKPKHLFEFVDVIHALLKGLCFLHDHDIAHGDIRLENALVNHVTNTDWPEKSLRVSLRLSRSLSYALYDFDFSVMLPAGVDKKKFRLPYYKAWGSFNIINDIIAGEHEYSPFAFDVGIMGVTLCQNYQYMSKDLPFLAPLLDMMTTWDLERRFTASEALQFFEQRLSEVPEISLKAKVLPYAGIGIPYYKYDRWQDLSPEFVGKWKAYKVPPLPWRLKVMRFIYRHSWNGHIVPNVRLFFIWLASIPRRISNCVLLSKNMPRRAALPFHLHIMQ